MRQVVGRLRRSISAASIQRAADSLVNCADSELAAKMQAIGWRLRAGEPFAKQVTECYAVVCAAILRVKGLRAHDVQIQGALAMARGAVAEMQTGEGKTLTGVFPAALFAAAGRGCHVITVNDYLAQRDAETLAPVFERLGLTCGCVTTASSPDERRQAYDASITFGTSKEFGFDYLRDEIARGTTDRGEGAWARESARLPGTVQRGRFFALVDEADSVLIDDARTPLVIGLARPQAAAKVVLFRWCDQVAAQLDRQRDYILYPQHRRCSLTELGSQRILVLGQPAALTDIDVETLCEHVERAIEVRYFFARDRHYTVKNEEVVLLDESTGRLLEGRKLQQGLHHALEAREGLSISVATENAARVTVQTYFSGYERLAGMTGTAWVGRGELRRVYGLKVARIPTHRPCLRRGLPTRVFATNAAKWRAVADTTSVAIAAGRSVLLGTPSVWASENLSAEFTSRGIFHRLLNARHESAEADIVAAAGQPGRVTIATNMAGRGTDIVLDEAVKHAGGLLVIATEYHSSARIDRQLVGRAARQGDPGSYQFLVSLEDELLLVLSAQEVAQIRARGLQAGMDELPASWRRVHLRVQRQLERRHRKQRQKMLKQERDQHEQFRKLGLSPTLELSED